jgi:hypothetical protein
MKLLLLAVLTLLLTGGALVQAQGCGVTPYKPYVPYGCKDLTPVCTCDSQGQHCTWQWVCVR